MPPKAKPKKVDITKTLFSNQKDDESLDWAASHNYDEPDPNQDQGAKSPNKANERHVAITKAASFENFRDAPNLGIPVDMPPPYVGFVKTFGKNVTEDDMRGYFSFQKIEQVLLVNNDRALFCLIEFATRDDLIKALMVTGTKMQYQYPCTVDVATPEQIEKLNRGRRSAQRSPVANKPSLIFDRDNMGNVTTADDFPKDDGEGSNRKGGNRGSGKGMSRSASGNVIDAQSFSRDAVFGSAEAPPPPPAADDKERGPGALRSGEGKFSRGGPVAVSAASADFSRDAMFGTSSASPATSPNPTNKPMFGRAGSSTSVGGNSDDTTNPPTPNTKTNNTGATSNMSRDMFGSTEVQPQKQDEGGRFSRKPKSPNSRNSPNNDGNNDRFPSRKDTNQKEAGGGDKKAGGGGAAGLGAWRRE